MSQPRAWNLGIRYVEVSGRWAEMASLLEQTQGQTAAESGGGRHPAGYVVLVWVNHHRQRMSCYGLPR